VSRHLALPLQLTAAGSFATVVEDSPEELTQNLATLLRTRPGERLATPELGTPDPTFAGLDPEAVLAVAAVWEPRADVQLVEHVLDAHGQERTTLAVRRREDS
jgi:phage baseplate assembly protein W